MRWPFGRRHAPSPVAAHAGSLPDRGGWWALADDDQRALAGPFRSIGRAGDVADAISAGSAWRWEPGD